MERTQQQLNCIIGTRISHHEKSYHLLSFDFETGTMNIIESLDTIVSPTFTIRHPFLPLLYAVSESAETKGVKQGAVVVVELAADSQSFSRISKTLPMVLSGGTHPCHLHIDKEGTTLFVSNYGDGVFSVIALDGNGQMKALSQRFAFAGVGTHPERQECSHIHSSILSPDERFIFVADLGLDRLVRYDCKREDMAKSIVLDNETYFGVAGGSGPRHMHFSLDGRFLYVVQELSNEISVFDYDAIDGSIQLVQTISTLPEDRPDVVHTAADIHVSVNGSFLYCSNRGHESIVCYTRDDKTGLLGVVGYFSCHGKHPRNFSLDAQGEWILIANADSDDVVICPIDKQTGAIGVPVHHVAIRQPVCICWL